MKILFICGTAEPGKDGVGDYTRQLSGTLINQGYQVSMVALFDSYINEVLEEDQFAIAHSIHTLRLPRKTSFSQRLGFLQKQIETRQPHCISIQYVPYSFSLKGTPLTLASLLSNTRYKGKWHIMIHEPFLRNHNLSFRNKIIRRLQILSLQRLKRKLRPLLWTTSVPYYQRMLTDSLQVNAKQLGLFGNVPYTKSENATSITTENYITAIYFGNAPVGNNQTIICKKLKEQIMQLPKKLHLLFCGKMGNDGLVFQNRIREIVESANGKVTVKGQLALEEISELLSLADFGIARVLPFFLGKSGTLIAMLEHGLPIWVPLATNDNEITQNLDFRTEQGFASLSSFAFKKKQEANERREQIAMQFVQCLL